MIDQGDLAAAALPGSAQSGLVMDIICLSGNHNMPHMHMLLCVCLRACVSVSNKGCRHILIFFNHSIQPERGGGSEEEVSREE